MGVAYPGVWMFAKIYRNKKNEEPKSTEIKRKEIATDEVLLEI